METGASGVSAPASYLSSGQFRKALCFSGSPSGTNPHCPQGTRVMMTWQWLSPFPVSLTLTNASWVLLPKPNQHPNPLSASSLRIKGTDTFFCKSVPGTLNSSSHRQTDVFLFSLLLSNLAYIMVVLLTTNRCNVGYHTYSRVSSLAPCKVTNHSGRLSHVLIHVYSPWLCCSFDVSLWSPWCHYVS